MKYVVIAARVLLGALFVFAGVIKILPLAMKQPPMPADAATWSAIMMTSHYLTVVGLFELIGGLLVLVGRFVPLGLTLLGPIVVNIILVSTLLNKNGYPVTIVMTAMQLFLMFVYRDSFKRLFDADPLVKTTV